MKSNSMLIGTSIAMTLAVLACGEAFSADQDKYSAKVPGGLALSEFKGYESWQVISVSHSGEMLAAILGNPTMIEAYKSGIPDNGKAFPDGAKMVKVHWAAKKKETTPGQPTVPGAQHDVDVMVKDSKRFADSGGWGYGYFLYDAASKGFTPATLKDSPPQGNDAKCGSACHTAAKARDSVFTEFPTK
jgi:hypothetical protein